MCGVFGCVGSGVPSFEALRTLASRAERRGSDAGGLFCHTSAGYQFIRGHTRISRLFRKAPRDVTGVLVAHSRLATNGTSDLQPVARDGVLVAHNGIVVNDQSLWSVLGLEPRQEIDTEVIAAIAAEAIMTGGTLDDVPVRIMELCRGAVTAAVAMPSVGALWLMTNTGDLYTGILGEMYYFCSERHPLEEIGCSAICQVNEPIRFCIPTDAAPPSPIDVAMDQPVVVPSLISLPSEERLLEFEDRQLQRCTNCVLPSTMPHITFDGQGVCNFCRFYARRNAPRDIHELQRLCEPYRRSDGFECIVPFSGGRDSTFALHLAVNELGLRPLTYTYDWGMLTDLGRRNISRMCSNLHVPNLLVADDIRRKRRHIGMNLKAWLDSPHLGLLSLLTAGDKHFFRHVRSVQRETGVSLNLWGVNPLEVTHFKAGFLGIPPDFEETRVYRSGWSKQLRYQELRVKAMLGSPKYFNSSLWDTLTGEYYRSIQEKSDYFHMFDFWRWDEGEIEKTLDDYEWERAPDTQASWRIGDGTAAFYNYVYYTVAGFTEHDTFRSNQVREGDLDRDTAMKLVREENRPRYSNIRWYLDVLGGFDFAEVINTVNRIPKIPG